MAHLEEIIYKCREDNSAAQTALYNLFSAKMYGVCLRYARDTGEAEDILQEGFVRVFSKIKQYEFKGSFEGWIRRVMVNTALEKFRKHMTYHMRDNQLWSWNQSLPSQMS